MIVQFNQALDIVSDAMYVTPGEILSTSRKEQIVEARKILASYLHYHLGYTPRYIGELLNKERSTVRAMIKTWSDTTSIYNDKREMNDIIFKMLTA